jgi:peptidoglycan/xylan/chitin deacetylase (PgdA/CDA1 family)
LLRSFLKFFPSLVSHIRTSERILFLTFDDGPVPEVTPEVLVLLKRFNAKATFFCVGSNVIKHHEIFRKVIEGGHSTGNHTFHHLNGWTCNKTSYLENVVLCSKAMQPKAAGKIYFRPPYGKLRFSQYAALKKNYKIFLWDVLTRDWESDRGAKSCFEIIKNQAKPGSIIVFHDSIKAKERMLPALEMTLEHYSSLGFRFEALEKFA